MPTSARDLRALVRDRLGGAKLIVVANREPYIHRPRTAARSSGSAPAGGLTTALDPVMRACGGIWVAHGSGDADRRSSTRTAASRVPPDDPSYVLRRVWLTKDEEQGYYYGFANSTLWPLCHQVVTRGRVRPGRLGRRTAR